jgi:CIC family chloride channel protein
VKADGNSVTLPKSSGRWLNDWLNQGYREPVILGVLALAIGIIGGLGAILFRDMIRWFFLLFHLGGVVHSPLRAIIPAVGLMLVGVITHFFAKEVKGHGVPQILESLALRGGRIRPRVAFFGILAPAITIGAGGSVGREGPIALIGGAFGSVLGQALKLSDKYISLLLACGAAAGIAATFNAPIAGGFFGLEVILGSYALGAIMPVFLSAVTGATIFDAIMGNRPVLQTANFHVIHPIALLFMIVLGLIAGALGLAYSKGLTWSEDLLAKWKSPFWVKNLAGGVTVGLIGLFAPQVLGVGYASIRLALAGELAVGTLLVLLLFKYIATLTTVGSGGSGGVFAPSLFLGAMLGAVYGDALRLIVPGLIPHPEIYAIAGMGAIFAASAQAPFVAITILLEVTGDYQLTPVVIAACVTAYVVHGILSRDSMYTVKLARRGIRILRGNEVRPTEQISVEQAMESVKLRIFSTDTLEHAYRTLTVSRDHAAVMLGPNRELLGVVTLENLRPLMEHTGTSKKVGELVTPMSAFIRRHRSLEEAMRMFTLHDVTMLPVLSEESDEVVGILTERDVIRAYNAFTIYSTESNAKIHQLQEMNRNSGQFVTLHLSKDSPVVGRALSKIRLPAEAVIVSIERRGKVLVPHGKTVFQEEDDILLFVSPITKVDEILTDLRGTTS